eukprot:836639-Karenia_brevis.AAC.1
MTYNRQDRNGNIVAQESRAETAAQYLAYTQWGEIPDRPVVLRRSRIVRYNRNTYRTGRLRSYYN